MTKEARAGAAPASAAPDNPGVVFDCAGFANATTFAITKTGQHVHIAFGDFLSDDLIAALEPDSQRDVERWLKTNICRRVGGKE